MVAKRERFEIFRRYGFACFYCGAKAPDVELEVDHVVPRKHGGTDDPWNLVSACQPCNAGKLDSLPTPEMIERALSEYRATIKAFDPHYRVVICTICTHPVQREIEDEGDDPQCDPCNDAISDAYMVGLKNGRASGKKVGFTDAQAVWETHDFLTMQLLNAVEGTFQRPTAFYRAQLDQSLAAIRSGQIPTLDPDPWAVAGG